MKILIVLSILISTSVFAKCEYDREKMLAMDFNSFDQDLEGGWRKLDKTEGCEKETADLIRDYRLKNAPENEALIWHEAQLRGFLEQNDEAIALFNKTRKPQDSDIFGWNYYIDATIAFILKDKEALLKNRALLSKLPKPEGFDPVDTRGNPMKFSWPMNLNVVDKFIKCFDQTYLEAYGKCE